MRLMEFGGARRIPLVGRRDLLKAAEGRIGRGGVHLIYLEGEGGIGKTALLEAILEQSQRGNNADARAGCRVARQIVDLYHVEVHTAEGLIRRIIEVLGDWSFATSSEALDALEEARISGDMGSANEMAQALQAAFFDEFAQLTSDGVVLAFDTMEVLSYERDSFEEELGESLPVFSAGEWLFRSFLPDLQENVVLLLAGRPDGTEQRLNALRQHNPRLMVRHTRLEPLSSQETAEYLRAIAQAEAKRGDGDAATRLWSFCEERRDLIHALTGGRPILLALVADLLAHGWELPPSFSQQLEELEEGEEPGPLWQEVEAALVTRIQESPTPIGDVLRALAWLRKGATPELLARVMELKAPDGTWDVYTATGYLDQVAQLALVKVRPDDRRIFLHDEMYALLEKHVLLRSSQEEIDRVHAAIRAYYQRLARELEQRIEQYPHGLAPAQAHLRQAMVEEMHYRLRHSPPLGFAMYFWLAEEALGGRDVEMDMLLRTEFLRTLGMLRESESFIGYLPREAEVDTAVRWGMRALFFQGDPEAALRIFDQVRRRWGKDAGKVRLAWAHLQLYRAVAMIQRADGDDWPNARELLADVEQKTNDMMGVPPETPVVKGRLWQARIMKSLALNFRGYLDRQQGRYLEAVQHYQASAMLQRRLGMAALVPTLTNLSYAMALTGDFGHARLLSQEAETLARRGGLKHMLAVTLNVRALVEEHDDRHKGALRYANRAMAVASELPAPRVRGLIHLTRARAQRYLWHSLTREEQELEPGFFDEALREANQAVTLLRSTPADMVDALMERGSLYREMARACHASGNREEAWDYREKCRKDYERVASLAGAMGLPRQQALVWTNLGWLHYYTGNGERITDVLEKATGFMPKDYLFPLRGPVPPQAQKKHKREATLPYWSTLGKIEMLRAYLALDQARAEPDPEGNGAWLKEAVKHVTFALAYDQLIADTYFELTRAEASLHRRILQDSLSIHDLHDYARQVAEQHGHEQPTRFQAFLERLFGPADLWA
jgi:tetratricopeptide (TPR) repeat protein